ncbi:UDP-2,3-diacylglucosamine diphosphatase, partial [Kaarinaea lacus]
MTTLFIADLHLTPEKPEAIKSFLHFLQTQAPTAEALYILGDLFEAWVGDDFIPPGVDFIVNSLAALTSSNVPVYVMHGNRDFLLGEGFAQQSGCELLPEYHIIDLYGTKTLLMHGDLLCTDDVEYMKFRQMVRNPQWQQDF